MDKYLTFTIDYVDKWGNERTDNEVALTSAQALDKFYELNGYMDVCDVYQSTSPYYYILKDEEGDIFEYRFPCRRELFYNLSKTYCFSDCAPEFSIELIMCDGHEMVYRGWMPGMVFEYYSTDGEVEWSETHENWDH